MKTFIIILICVLLIIIFFTVLNLILSRINLNYVLNNFDKVKYQHQLEPKLDVDTGCNTFYSDSSFKVIQLTDIHIGGGFMSFKKDRLAFHAVAAMIKEEKPDLVAVTGDIAYPVPFQSGTFNNKAAAMLFLTLMDCLGVYFAPVFGNHDTESYAFYNRQAIGLMYENYVGKSGKSYCLFKCGNKKIDGVGNYCVNIKNSKSVITRTLIFMDTGSYVDGDYFGFKWKYDGLHQNQIEWYEKKLHFFEKYNKTKGSEYKMPKSMLFIHIPLQEYRAAWYDYKKNSKDTDDVKYIYGGVGEKQGKMYPSLYSNTMFSSMLALDSTKAVFCGHDHLNNFSVECKGIRLTYGLSIDYLAYIGIKKYGAQRGCTLININGCDNFDISPQSYYQEKYKAYDNDFVTMKPYYNE